MTNKAIILLSGGLDSLVSLGVFKNKFTSKQKRFSELVVKREPLKWKSHLHFKKLVLLGKPQMIEESIISENRSVNAWLPAINGISIGQSPISSLCRQSVYNITYAISFDYGQRAAAKEIEASRKIAEYYNIDHKVIELPWLAEITTTSLVNRQAGIPDVGIDKLDDAEITEDSARRVWVPNRNGVFLNIAASFADSMGFTHIIFGANREEAATFPDNSEAFVEKINASFEYSTLVKPKVVAPLAKFVKEEIVKLGVKHKVPFNLLRSCYLDEEKHCGKCESCLRLKRALQQAIGDALPVDFKN